MHINDGTDQTVDGWPAKDRPIFAESVATPGARSWWVRLGLVAGRRVGVSGNERAVARRQAELLDGLRPTGFVRESDGAELALEDVEAELAQIAQIAETAKTKRADAAAERLAFGWARVREALGASDAGEVITDGRWAGFERGTARAWCWNLFQFEPHGFVFPGSKVRADALRELENGGLPAVFGYPERAAELAAHGLNPVGYREAQVAIGKPTFAREDVVFG